MARYLQLSAKYSELELRIGEINESIRKLSAEEAMLEFCGSPFVYVPVFTQLDRDEKPIYSLDNIPSVKDAVLEVIQQMNLVPALWRKVEIISEDAVRVWAAGIDYIVGDEVAYPDENGTMYTCQQAHTSQTGWEPPAVPALWTAHNESGDDSSPVDDTGLMNDEGQIEEA